MTEIAAHAAGERRVGLSSLVAQRQSHKVGRGLIVALLLAGLYLPLHMLLSVESLHILGTPGGLEMAIARFCGLFGSYLLLVMVVIMARLPTIERAFGQERLVRWHRRVGAWPLVLITLHIVFVSGGYGALDRSGAIREFWRLLVSYPDVLAALAGLILLLIAAASSWGWIRRRLHFETWWVLHLYIYLGLALAFAHQLANGATFVHAPLNRALWIALWIATAGVVFVYRIGVPIWRSCYHGLRVLEVEAETPGVVSVVCGGRRLDRLHVAGGQYMLWRFLTRGLWLDAHPYSLSALPIGTQLRLTVKDSGDQSGTLAHLRPGTRVAIEGPYGAFTDDERRSDAVALIGAGIGVTPLRALIEDLPEAIDVVVVLRGSTDEDLPLRQEMAELVAERHGTLHVLAGPRSELGFDRSMIEALIPDLARRDLYVCGPKEFRDEVLLTAHSLKMPKERVHYEAFDR